MRLRSNPLLVSFLCLATAAPSIARAQSGSSGGWVGTWAASPFSEPNKNNAFATDTTVREIVHLSVGGSAVRIILTNEFGGSDLKIGGATVALPSTAADGSIQPASAVPVRFSGQPSVTIASGALAVSDPIPMHVAAQSDLAITLFVPGQPIDAISYHGFADQTNFGADGNQLNAPALTTSHPLRSWVFLKGVDVQGSAQAAIVCFGDSITDGAHSTPDTNRRWPDVLAQRLQANRATANLGVLNEGIGGNRVLHDVTGPSALARFDRDVLAQTGVRYLIILEGINDIGRLANPHLPGDLITADDIIAAYQQMITRAHLHGIKVYGATLTPYQGAKYESETGEAARDKVNDFILHSGQFDGAIDFAKVTADPANPKSFAASADSGDHLHPADAGYKAMGDSIDLKLFTK